MGLASNLVARIIPLTLQYPHLVSVCLQIIRENTPRYIRMHKGVIDVIPFHNVEIYFRSFMYPCLLEPCNANAGIGSPLKPTR
jgi:hypothetical protein